MTLRRDLQTGKQTNVQFLLNAMDANTATIARSYAQSVIAAYSANLPSDGSARSVQSDRSERRGQHGQYRSSTILPLQSWPRRRLVHCHRCAGTACHLNGWLVASNTMVREREYGTIEQLLMSPASTSEIIIAKIAPLFVLLCLMTLNAICVGRLAFHVPFHGSFLLVYFGSMLCVLCGIGIGTFLATFTKTSYQAQLAAFFVNPPLASPLRLRHTDGGDA